MQMDNLRPGNKTGGRGWLATAILVGVCLIGAKPGAGQIPCPLPAFTELPAELTPDLTGVEYASVAWGDYDNDGDLDLAVAGVPETSSYAADVYIYRNDGAGGFVKQVSFSDGDVAGKLTWGDYNNDGHLDLLAVRTIYRNNGDGSFTDHYLGYEYTDRPSGAWGDYDNDGDLDLLLANYDSTRIYRNDGDFAFIDIGAPLPACPGGSAEWGDYDNDGDLDMLLTGASGLEDISRVYRNDGGGTFTDINAALPGVRGSCATWGDYDNDGDLDILLTGSSDAGRFAGVFRNEGQDFFTQIQTNMTPVSFGTAAWGDYNNDGNLDILLAGSPGTNRGNATVYRNDGDGVFTDIGELFEGIVFGAAAWGDYDNDGDLDIALAGLSFPESGDFIGIAKIYTNNACVANTAPVAPSPGDVTVDEEGSATFEWGFGFDLETPILGLNYNLRVGTAPGLSDVKTPMANPATGFRKIAARGNVDGMLSHTIHGLTPGQTYYWSVQAIDTAFAGSPYTLEQSFSVPEPCSIACPRDVSVFVDDPCSDAGGTIVEYPLAETTGDCAGDLVYNPPSGSFFPLGDTEVLVESADGETTCSFTVTVDPAPMFLDIQASLDSVYEGDLDWGDYDNDGDLDLVIVGEGDLGGSAIYRNEGGVFIPIGSGVYDMFGASVDWGDYDGDGDLDLLISGMPGDGAYTYIYRNDGYDTFSEIQSGLPGAFLGSAQWGDFDNDGDLDVLLTGIDGFEEISRVYENQDGTFVDIQTGLTNVAYGDSLWGDLDGDGDLDILLTGGYTQAAPRSTVRAAGQTPVTKIYLNNGDKTFAETSSGLPELTSTSADLGDIDGDGDLDILLSGENSEGEISSHVFLNEGDGTFTELPAGLDGTYQGSADLADFDNDGDLDILLTNSIYPMDNGPRDFTAETLVYRNDGGTFTKLESGLPLLNGYGAWGDVGGDGILEIALIGEEDDGRPSARIYKLNVCPPCEFTCPADITVAETDPCEDGAYVNYPFPQISDSCMGTPVFDPPYGSYFPTGTTLVTVTSEDGLTSCSFNVTVVKSDTLFIDTAANLIGVEDGDLDWGDYDGDGDLDLVIAGFDKIGDGRSTRLYRNDNGTLTQIPESQTNLQAVEHSSVKWGDYDGDGDLDLALSGFDGSSLSTKIYRNDGNDIFTDINAGLPGISNGSIDWGDFDKDGDLDLLFTGSQSGPGNIAHLYENQNGTFVDSGAALTGVYGGVAKWGDLDSDGDLDILISGDIIGTPSTTIYLNDGNKNFMPADTGLPDLRSSGADFADFDGDGDLDILLAGYNNNERITSIFRNDSGTFTDIQAGLLNVNGGSVNWGDYDNDGDLDVLIQGAHVDGSNGFYAIYLYRNDGGTFTLQGNTGLPALNDGRSDLADLDGDGLLEVAMVGTDNLSLEPFAGLYRLNVCPCGFTCPTDITVDAAEGACGAVVEYPDIQTSGNCGDLLFDPPAGFEFAVGRTTVTVMTGDAHTSCSFFVTVRDVNPPQITCPTDITVNAPADQCFANVDFEVPVSDECGTVTVSSFPEPGSQFPVGTTLVESTATDASGNETTCTFNVTVLDVTPPMIDCPGDIEVDAAENECSATVEYPMNVTDGCAIVPRDIIQLPGGLTVETNYPSGSDFPVGVTDVITTATDASGNVSVCTFYVTVKDVQSPTIECPNDIVVDSNPGECGAAVQFTVPASDTCGDVTVESTPASGSVFPVGTTVVHNLATDSSGNQSRCTFTVTVVDVEAPTVSCPRDITLSTESGECGDIVAFDPPSASDNCGTVTVVSAPESGSFFPVGVTDVITTATDAAGNVTTCSFTVTLNDARPPEITCPSDMDVLADEGASSKVISFDLFASDNCGTATVSSVPESGSTFPVGVTTVEVTATDAAGNNATCSFKVTVRDANAPTVACPVDITVDAEKDQCGAVVGFEIVASDADSTVTIESAPKSGSRFNVGVTDVVTTVTDAAGNVATCSFTVTVRDTQAPTIACPADIVVDADLNECSQVVAFDLFASDNCGTATVESLPESGAVFPVGTTDVLTSATDAAGNVTTCTFAVTVNDITPPTITCPVDMNVPSDDGVDGATVEYSAEASDDCSDVSVWFEPESGSLLPLGDNAIVAMATDASGNQTSCTFTVHVRDANPGLDAGWVPSGIDSGPEYFLDENSIDDVDVIHDGAALGVLVRPSVGRYRVAGWVNNAIMSRNDILPGQFVRGKFYVTVSNPADAPMNEVPNFRVRLQNEGVVLASATYGYAATGSGGVSYEPFYDTVDNPATEELVGPSLRPSPDENRPSLYRLDFDPLDVPASAGTDIRALFESCATQNPADGMLMLTEVSLGVYPVPEDGESIFFWSNNPAFDENQVGGEKLMITGRFNAEPNFEAGRRQDLELPQEDPDAVFASIEDEGESGWVIDTDSVPQDRFGAGLLSILGSDETRVPRIEENKIYRGRFLVSSDVPTIADGEAESQGTVLLGLKTGLDGLTARLELIGPRNSVAPDLVDQELSAQVLPGIGSLIADQPEDGIIPDGEAGGWYTLQISTPLDSDITRWKDGDLSPLIDQPGPGEPTTETITLRDLPGDVSPAAPRDILAEMVAIQMPEQLKLGPTKTLPWAVPNRAKVRVIAVEIIKYGQIDDGGYGYEDVNSEIPD